MEGRSFPGNCWENCSASAEYLSEGERSSDSGTSEQILFFNKFLDFCKAQCEAAVITSMLSRSGGKHSQADVGMRWQHVDVVLTQWVDDDGFAPVHQVSRNLEYLNGKTRHHYFRIIVQVWRMKNKLVSISTKWFPWCNSGRKCFLCVFSSTAGPWNVSINKYIKGKVHVIKNVKIQIDKNILLQKIE